MFDARAWIVGGLITAFLVSGFFVFIGGFVYGLVVSLVFNIRRAFSSALYAIFIVSCLSHLMWVYNLGWFSCLSSIECINEESIAGIAELILFYTIVVLLSIPIGMIGISLGIFIRYIAGIIAGTYTPRQ